LGDSNNPLESAIEFRHELLGSVGASLRVPKLGSPGVGYRPGVQLKLHVN